MSRLALLAGLAFAALALAQVAPVGGLPYEPGGGNVGVASVMPIETFFEFAPVGGAGMGTACACAPITGSKGEPITFSRAGKATCTKTGLGTTGIAAGDLVECAPSQPRVMPDNNGVLGLLAESDRTNFLLRFIELGLSPWADVGTPTLTTGQPSPWAGTWANSAVSISDDDAASKEGRSQSWTSPLGTTYVMWCYVKAGTADSATVSLGGGTQTITGLSSSTWSIVELKMPSIPAGTVTSAQVLVGDADAVTGSVLWGGCQLEYNFAGRTSMVPTTTATAGRGSDLARLSVPAGVVRPDTNSWSMHVSRTSTTIRYSLFWAGANEFVPATNSIDNTTSPPSSVRCAARVGSTLYGTSYATIAQNFDFWCSATGPSGQLTGALNGGALTPSASFAAPSTDTVKRVFVGVYPGANYQSDSLISRVCLDYRPDRCR